MPSLTLRSIVRLGGFCLAALIFGTVLPGPARGVDTGAVMSGDWSSATTWSNGVPGSVGGVYIGSTYPAGAIASATVTLSQNTTAGDVYIGYGPGTSGTLDLAGATMTVEGFSLYLGQNGGSGSIVRTGGGTLTVGYAMYQNSGNFAFSPGDSVRQLVLSNGSTATTATDNNVPNAVEVDPGSALTLGAGLKLVDYLEPFPKTGTLDLRGTLNANGYPISATTVNLGFSGGPFLLNNRGPITAANLAVSSVYSPTQTTFDLTNADSVYSFSLYGVNTVLPADVTVKNLYLSGTSTASTTAGNVTNYLSISVGSTLTLGADLPITFTLQINNGGTLNANGYAVSASLFLIGDANGAGTLQNAGPVAAKSWQQTSGSRVRLNRPGDVLGTLLLTNNSTLAVGDAVGQMTGLTIANSTSADLGLTYGSDLLLEMNGLAGGWILRWANPTGGDHLVDLQNLIAANEITFSYLNGGSYSLSADSAYTYINVVPVPEPSTMAFTAAVGLLAGLRRIRKSAP